MSSDGFASADVARAWPYIQRSVDRIVDRCCEATAGQLHWRPAANANSLAVLATHAMGNLDHRLLGLLCGQERPRDRGREFEEGTISAQEIAERWGHLCAELEVALSRVTQARVDRTFDHPERGPMTGHDILIIAARHMASTWGRRS